MCLKRMQKALLPVCKIETGVFGLSSGLPLLRRRAGVSSQDAGLWGVNRVGGHEGSGWAGGPPRLLSAAQPHSTHQIRRRLAVAAAAARARVTGTLTKEGAEGAPPLPSSPGSQIFVVGGGASELVVLVVVSGEHGGNSGEGWGPPQIWGSRRHGSCLLCQTSAASPVRQPQPHPSGRFWLLPPGTQMTPPSSGPC